MDIKDHFPAETKDYDWKSNPSLVPAYACATQMSQKSKPRKPRKRVDLHTEEETLSPSNCQTAPTDEPLKVEEDPIDEPQLMPVFKTYARPKMTPPSVVTCVPPTTQESTLIDVQDEPLDTEVLGPEKRSVTSTGVQVDLKESAVVVELKLKIESLTKQLTIKMTPLAFVSGSDQKGKFFTGLCTEERNMLWEFLGPAKYCLTMWGNFTNANSSEIKSATVEDQFVITLVTLRRDYDFQETSYQFQIDRNLVSVIFHTWLQFMYQKFYDIRIELFVEREDLPQPLPKCFRNALLRNCRVVIDCTELFIEGSCDFQEQGNSYSSYKSHTTAKVLIGVAPSGACTFVSHCYEGAISDRDIVIQSQFIDQLNPNDMVLADRGFLIEDLVAEQGARLNIPPFLKGRPNFTLSETMYSKIVARARIHVGKYSA